jgi:hypothetical protein
MGGPLFMSILTILLIIIVVWIIYHFVQYFISSDPDKEKTLRNLRYGMSIGLFALVTGILGQLIGLYMAFVAIEAAADISPAIVFGGLKISMITTLYGVIIYLISIFLWFVGSVVVEKAKKQ